MIGSLYFDDKFYNQTLIAKNIELNEAGKYIVSTIKELYPDFKIYYLRAWTEDGIIVHDFGSHSEFFKFIPKGDEDE